MIRPRSLALALALALLCAMAPAHAGTVGQDLLLPLGGSSHYPGASADYNFASGQLYGPTLSDTRAGSESEICNGTLYTFPANTAPITPCGLWAWEARNNLIFQNQFSGLVAGVIGSGGSLGTGWQIANSGSGVVITVIGSGFDSGVPYADVSFAGTESANGQNITIYRTSSTEVSTSYGQTYTGSWYVKLQNGTNSNIAGVGNRINELNTGSSYITGTNNTLFPTSSGLSLNKNIFNYTISSPLAAYVQFGYIIFLGTAAPVNFTYRFALPQLELNPNLLASVANGAQTITNSGTSNCVSGTYTVVGGTGTAATLTGVAAGGVITSLTTLTNGAYSVMPPSPAALTGTGCSGSPTVTLTPTDNSAKAFATGPILTSGAAVTRNQNVLPANVGAYANASVFAKIAPQSPSGYPMAEWAAAYGGANGIGLLTPSGSSTATYAAGGSTFSMGLGSFTQASLAPFAVAYGAGTENLLFNGSTATGANAATSSGSTLYVGSDSAGANPCNCLISRVAFFPNKQTTGQLKSLR